MQQATPQSQLNFRFLRSVPVWIDDLKELEGFPVTRCLYLSLTIDAASQESPFYMPLPEGSFSSDVGQLGLLMQALEAIVTGPAPGATFDSADDFARLFDRIEAAEAEPSAPGRTSHEPSTDLDVELGFIWLPNRVVAPALARISGVGLERASRDPSAIAPAAKGQVLRVEANLFLEALAASAEERVPGGTPFIERALDRPEWALEAVRPSPAETAALLEFSEREVAEAGRQLEERQESDREVLLWEDPERGLMRGDRPIGDKGDV